VADSLRRQLAQQQTLVIDVKAIPRAQKSEVIGLMPDGTLKVKVAAVPEKGKANEELRRLLAVYFGVPNALVELISGETSPRKRFRVSKAAQ
jgi:uncharacterized protein